jgi:hypothetical protein
MVVKTARLYLDQIEVLSAKIPKVAPQYRDEIVFALTPGEGTEYKPIIESGLLRPMSSLWTAG